MLRHKKPLALAALVVIGALLVASGALPDLPDPQRLITDIATALGPWTYVLVGGMAFLETGAFVGLVAPGETTVIVGGVIAGQGEISVVPLIGLVWLCCVLGDTASFFIGRRLGRSFLVRHGPKIKVDEERLEHVESYFERHGGKTILIGRFIGLVRAVSPFVAGSSGLPFGRFLPFSIIGSGLWATLFCLLGFIFYRSFDRVTAVAGKATLAFGITVALIAGGIYAYRRLRRAENRRALAAWFERQGRRPALRPLAAILGLAWRGGVRPVTRLAAPRVRFLLDRLTPGHLGLELTTALAVAGVGFYVFVLYAVVLSEDPGATHGDRELLDLADDLHSERAVDVVQLITDLGSFLTVSTLILSTALLLLLRRHFTEAVALVAGALLLYVGVRIAKEGIDRPRPARPLQVTHDASFPSGHAAYSTIWIGVALVVAGAFEGLASRAALVTVATVIALAIGLSRIYLRAHFWSDVAGGWGLGAGILAACAAIGLIVSYIRQNGGEPAASGGSP
ncbi:MAG: bifunctional DedA family/phosphatase PAP2 family protein [Actinomycetota bacterium]|nr:bifunctional DedA family/phosphatase PAP2 family protein [Actinomycetota bacterium]